MDREFDSSGDLVSNRLPGSEPDSQRGRNRRRDGVYEYGRTRRRYSARRRQPHASRGCRQAGRVVCDWSHVNESVRIDDQLRGRSGRQGDPGASVFFVSLEDELLLRFGINKAIRAPRQDEALEESVLRSQIAHIQRFIMGQNFHIRQELNCYSDMVEDQRRILYEEPLGGSNDSAKFEEFGLKSLASTRSYIINDQYIQNRRSSWTAVPIFAFWIRKMLSPVFKWAKL